jgi:uncharacterized membrane protein
LRLRAWAITIEVLLVVGKDLSGELDLEQLVSFLFKYKEEVFSKSQFSFQVRPSPLLIALVAVAMLVLAYLFYWRLRPGLAPAWRGLLMGLRLMLLTVIAFCLMRPVIVIPSVIPQSSFVAVLMDDSASMLITDEGGRTRLDVIKQLMSPDSPFSAALSDKFKVRHFKFSESAERVQDVSALTGAGQQTNLAISLDQAARELAGLPVSGIILISDGAQNTDGDITAVLADLRARGIPVYTVGVGKTSLEPDVEIVRATAPRRVLAGSSVVVELLVLASQLKSKILKINIEEDGHLLRSQDVPVQANGTTEVVRVSFTPTSAGLHRYRLAAASVENELVLENNSQEVLVEVEDSHPRVLYVEGEPRWEYGKLRSAFAEEKNVVLVSLLRSADGKYYRQGVESGEELAAGFPKSEEELFKYDALMIGSVEATFFTFDQLKMIEQFVSRRGGTLLALGGPKSFNAGGYANTPMADLLPIYLNGQVVAGENQAFKAALPERGRVNRVAQLEDQAEANRTAWERMPAITLPEVIVDTKPGATVILEARGVRDKNRVVPLLVEERYGRGRTLAFLASDTWRWRMLLESKITWFETFWRNLARYMVESVRRPLEVSTERSFYGPGEQVRIRAEIADKKFIPITDARAIARVTTPSGRSVELALKPQFDGGFESYAGQLRADEEGVYQVEVIAQRSSKDSLGVARASFSVGVVNREAYSAAQNRELLSRIAVETGGAYYTLERARSLIEDIAHTDRGNSVRETRDLWDMPINFLLVVVLAASEWFIRKHKGLA